MFVVKDRTTEERYADEYRFYTRCLRVLSKKKGKRKLIVQITIMRDDLEYRYHNHIAMTMLIPPVRRR